ncbi:hypothetical protein N2152v2_001148 [Parachlorella kessleri]
MGDVLDSSYKRLDVEVTCGHGEMGKKGCASWKRWKDSIKLVGGAPIRTLLKKRGGGQQEGEQQDSSGAEASKPRKDAAVGTSKAKTRAAIAASKHRKGAADSSTPKKKEAGAGASKPGKAAERASKPKKQQRTKKKIEGNVQRKATLLRKKPSQKHKRRPKRAGVQLAAKEELLADGQLGPARQSSMSRRGGCDALLAAAAMLSPTVTHVTAAMPRAPPGPAAAAQGAVLATAPAAAEPAIVPTATAAAVDEAKSLAAAQPGRAVKFRALGSLGAAAAKPAAGSRQSPVLQRQQHGSQRVATSRLPRMLGAVPVPSGAALVDERGSPSSAAGVPKMPIIPAVCNTIVTAAGRAAADETSNAAAVDEGAAAAAQPPTADDGSGAGEDPLSLALVLIAGELRERARRQQELEHRAGELQARAQRQEELERRVEELEAAVAQLKEEANKRRRIE